MPPSAPLTVKDVLALPQFQGCRVLAGEAGLDRPVTGLNLTDLTDYADWLTPDELLATTCFSIREDRQAQEAFIPTLWAHRLSGVCIKPHRFLDEIPGFMVRSAGELGFPLVELPPAVQFRDLSWAVFEAVRSRSGAAPLVLDDPELLSFLRHLFLDAVTDEAAERERAAHLGCDLAGPFCVARFQVLPGQGQAQPTPAQTHFLYRDLLSLLCSAGLSCSAAVDGGQLLLVLSALPAPHRLSRLLSTALDQLASGYPGLRFLLARSRPGSGTAGMRRCCGEARAAIQVLAGREEAVCSLCYAELGLARLVFSPDPREEAALLAGDVLAPLRAEPELLATLACWFRCLGNLKRVSQETHAHYNTVAYRIRRVQDLTGLDLHDPDGRFLLELALRLDAFSS